ncbi:MAG: hypothetical protein FWE80_02405 [Oscillospiraceae bacterium]|nr:hypothetical protein [Oscillospiraceae bacterium]
MPGPADNNKNENGWEMTTNFRWARKKNPGSLSQSSQPPPSHPDALFERPEPIPYGQPVIQDEIVFQPAETAERKRPGIVRRLLGVRAVRLALAAAVLIAAVCGYFAAVYSPPAFFLPEHGLALFSLPESTLVLFDDYPPVEIDGYYEILPSPNRDWLIYGDRDDNIVMLLPGKDPVPLSHDIMDWTFSTDGQRAAFLTKSGELYSLPKGGEPVLVAEKADRFVSSPDGRSLFYSSGDLLYLVTGGQTRRLSQRGSVYPAGVSNGGTVMYFYADEGLYLRRGIDSESVRISGRNSTIQFNCDGTEIFTGSRLAILGKKPVIVSSEYDLTLVTPLWDGSLPADIRSWEAHYLPNRHFAGMAALGNDNLYRLGSTAERTVHLASFVDQVWCSDDGRSLLYTALCWPEGNSPDYRGYGITYSEKAEKGLFRQPLDTSDAPGIRLSLSDQPLSLQKSIAVSPDLEHIYYLSEENNLMYIRGIQPAIIAGAEIAAGASLTIVGETCFCLSGGELYYSTAGSLLEPVNSVTGQIEQITTSGGYTYVLSNTGVWRSAGDSYFMQVGRIVSGE